jgi:hypothetical protein
MIEDTREFLFSTHLAVLAKEVDASLRRTTPSRLSEVRPHKVKLTTKLMNIFPASQTSEAIDRLVEPCEVRRI